MDNLMKKKSSPPQAMKNLLVGIFVATILLGGAGFYLGLNVIRDYAIQANKTAADAKASSLQVDQLQKLKNQLSESESLIAKANLMFATPENYQSQALTDIRAYAAKAGITVTKTDFEENTDTAIQGRIVDIALQEPVPYSNLIVFLNGLEGNLPKMQVSSLGITRSDTPGAVIVNDLKIIISTK